MPAKRTAERDALGEFAPKFAALNDDVLFGEVWSRESELPLRTRRILCRCGQREQITEKAQALRRSARDLCFFVCYLLLPR